MTERQIILAFARALVETPFAIILLILDLVGIFGVVYWVVDDPSELTIILIFLAVLITSQYLVFRKLWRQLQSTPHILFTQARQAQMYQDSHVVDRSIPTYQVLQAWFVNTPSSPTDSSVAHEVTAKLTLLSPLDTQVLEYHGQWAQSNAPDNVGFDTFLDKIDIPPGHLQAKLFVALKYPLDSEAYAFTREGFRSATDGRSPRYKIHVGDYRLKVHLRGIGVDHVFLFRFQYRGADRDFELTTLPDQ